MSAPFFPFPLSSAPSARRPISCFRHGARYARQYSSQLLHLVPCRLPCRGVALWGVHYYLDPPLVFPIVSFSTGPQHLRISLPPQCLECPIFVSFPPGVCCPLWQAPGWHFKKAVKSLMHTACTSTTCTSTARLAKCTHLKQMYPVRTSQPCTQTVNFGHMHTACASAYVP